MNRFKPHLQLKKTALMTFKYAKHPSGKHINFNTKNHVYQMGNKEILTNVTTFISNFFPSFKIEKISNSYAIQHGLNQEDVLSNWESIGQEERS